MLPTLLSTSLVDPIDHFNANYLNQIIYIIASNLHDISFILALITAIGFTLLCDIDIPSYNLIQFDKKCVDIV